MTKILFFILIKNGLPGPDRNGTGMNRDEPVPVPNHGTVPFRVPVQCIPSRP